MKEKIKDLIYSHRDLKYIYTFISNIKNDQFSKHVFKIKEDPFLLNLNSRGNLQFDNYICEIKPVITNEGFFAVFRRALNGLFFSEYINAIPSIIYTPDFMYYEKDMINGTNNPYEYYFEPVSNVTEKDLAQAKFVIEYSGGNNKLAESLNDNYFTRYHMPYYIKDEYIVEMGRIMKKYIHLNETTNKCVYDSINSVICQKKTLAVHARGTDFREHYKFHPNMVEPSDYFPMIDNAMLEYGFEQIFLATDDIKILSLFKDRYKNTVVYYNDVFRGDCSKGIHTTNEPRLNHHYLLGLEVIRDMYTLASCDGFISGKSQVSLAARCAKASFGKEFEYFSLIDKGTVKTGKLFYINRP